MTVSSLFNLFVGYIVGIVFFVPATILKAVGLLLPPCASFGYVAIPAQWLNDAYQWIRWSAPVLEYLPLTGFWTLANAFLFLFLFWWFWKKLPWLISLGPKVWIIIVVLYVASSIFTFFGGDAWRDSPAFTDAFGEAPTSTLGGGGGPSW